jgi:hypothetical protein
VTLGIGAGCNLAGASVLRRITPFSVAIDGLVAILGASFLTGVLHVFIEALYLFWRFGFKP